MKKGVNSTEECCQSVGGPSSVLRRWVGEVLLYGDMK